MGAKHLAAAKLRWQDPTYRAKQSAASKRAWWDPAKREKRLATLKLVCSRPAARAKQSAAMRRIWLNPEFRAKFSAAMTPEIRAKRSEAQKRTWRDPMVHARASAAAKRADRPCLDHDHKTGVIRGVLCTRCNTKRGLEENLDCARRWVAYLEHHAAPRHPRWSDLLLRERRELRRILLNEQGGRCAVCQRELNELSK